MKKLLSLVFCLSAICAIFGSVNAQNYKKNEISAPKDYRKLTHESSPELQKILDDAVGASLAKNFKAEEIAVSLIDVRDSQKLKSANVRGEAKIYPASVVKMFYMAALERQLEDGKIKATTELERGLKDMIVDSSNEATQYILDVLTDTASGGELPAEEFEKWSFNRNRVNRFYALLGYENINVNQKTHCEDAYGREQQFRNYKSENRNMLTANAAARLMTDIVLGKITQNERTKMMLDLMKRDPFVKSGDNDDQSTGFSGKALIDMNLKDARLWSKAGWTSKSRHDVAYIETVDGLKFVVAVFTENHANERETIPAIVRKIIENLQTNK